MECYKLITVRHGDACHKVPCGKCAFCLTNKRSQWMFRVHYEMRTQLYKGHFVTLTYDEKHVKRVDGGRLSLRFRDVQLFLKRVRKEKYYCKYICVGEYGGQTKRPHYHMLLWTDCPTSLLESFWKLGHIHYGRLTMASAMYTLKYIIQPKQKAEDGIEKTRAQFSKGLGLGYLDNAAYNYHTHSYEDPQMFSVVDGRKVSLPRYYRNKIFTKYQQRLHAEKARVDSIKNKWKTYRELMKQGFFNDLPRRKRIQALKGYIDSLRLEECKRIISSTKFNQSL